MTPFWFDLITRIDDLDYNSCFQLTFEFEPHKFRSCMKIVSPSRLRKKGLKPTGKSVSTQIFTSQIFSAWQQHWGNVIQKAGVLHNLCLYANSKKQTKENHILLKCLVNDRKKRNYITPKSLPEWEGKVGAEEKARLSGVLKTEEEKRVGGLFWTHLNGCTLHRMPINLEAHKGRTQCAADQSSWKLRTCTKFAALLFLSQKLVTWKAALDLRRKHRAHLAAYQQSHTFN